MICVELNVYAHLILSYVVNRQMGLSGSRKENVTNAVHI